MNQPSNTNKNILRVNDLKIYFSTPTGTAYAVDGVSFAVRTGETLAIVGESGCGKSVTAMSILRLLPSPPVQQISGNIFFHDTDLLSLSEAELRKIRGRKIAMIFQEPTNSLNPVFTVGNQIVDILSHHYNTPKLEAIAKIQQIFEWVGISEPSIRLRQYPHELSGGLVQRVMIAMALANEPELLIADEPTTALDVTIQAEILALLRKIQIQKQMSLLLISHDLSVVAQLANRIVVLYAGKKVEEASAKVLYSSPAHPYTRALFDSLPIRSQGKKRLSTIPGSVPSAVRPPTGCRFHPRCPYAMDICSQQEPPWITLQPEQGTACWLFHPHSQEGQSVYGQST